MMSVFVYALGFLLAGLLLLYSYYAKILDWILIVMALSVMAVLVATDHFPSKVFVNCWLGAFLSTFLFWAVVKSYRRSWRNQVLWVTVGILAVLQASLVYLVGKGVERVRPIWVYPMFLIEGPILVTALTWSLHRFGRHQQRHRRTDS